jgi:ribonuclease Z
LARIEGGLILFDCGEGTQIPWKQYKWGFRRLSTICLTHHHADHVAGLPGLLHTVANAGRTAPIHLYGPRDTTRIVNGLRVIAPELPYDLVIHELEDGDTFDLPGGLQGSVCQGQHPMSCLAYRLDLPRKRRFNPQRARTLGVPQDLWQPLQRGESVAWPGGMATPDDVMGPPRRGISFAYVTDTRPVPAFVPFLHDTDLLVCEATYADDTTIDKAIRYGHMSAIEAAKLAREAQVHRLWLTHFGAAITDPQLILPNAQAIFPATEAAVSGLTTTLNFPH